MSDLQWTAQQELLERFLDAASRGDLTQVSSLLSTSPSLIDQSGQNGWTALMLAARNGHYNLVEGLLEHGCDRLSVNRSSQTAHDIAKFWGHRHISNLLTGSGHGRVLSLPEQSHQENYFSREPLDRLSAKRMDSRWLLKKQSDPETVYLLFSKLSPMICSSSEEDKTGVETRLCRFGYEAVKDLLEKPGSVLVFLGVERSRRIPGPSSELQPAACEPPGWFAVGSDGDPDGLLKRCREKHCSFPKIPNRDLLKLSEDEAGMVAQARSTLAWHSRYSFCPTCGSDTRLDEAGYKRSCVNSECRSLQGIHNTCYPRVDPVVIMLVVHPDQNQCLLGRKKVFPAGMFSCLAGFIEPGESMEAAVQREVQEESGVTVGPVQYVSSQPWPMPSSLMIGCLAIAVTTDIKVDQNEIEEAQWFTRQQVTDSLISGPRAAFTFPPRQTIAHQLIKQWLGLSSNL